MPDRAAIAAGDWPGPGKAAAMATAVGSVIDARAAAAPTPPLVAAFANPGLAVGIELRPNWKFVSWAS